MAKKRKLHYPRKWSWPDGARICVSLNMALESFVRASQVTLEKTSNKVDHFSLTYADYAYKAGVWRLMDLMDELKLKGIDSASDRTWQPVAASTGELGLPDGPSLSGGRGRPDRAPS